MELQDRSIAEIGGLLRDGKLTSTQLTQVMLDRIAALNSHLNAFITIAPDQALAAAHQADRDLAARIERGPLLGIPVAIKDNIATAGLRTTCGSLLYGDWVPEQDATVVARLRQAGAVILGKTGLHELAYGTTSMNPFFGAVENPAAPGRDPGGSSGGSASAVAAGLAFAALGTDTACSIRYPAHCCGIVGYKPSFGLVSTAGVLPLVRSLDHVGPLTRSVADAALVIQAIAGHDPLDAYSSRQGLAPFTLAAPAVSRLRIGVARSFFFQGDHAILLAVEQVIERLLRCGAEIVDLDGAVFDGTPQLTRMAFVEAHAFHAAELAARPAMFSPELRGKLNRFATVSAADYIQAAHERQVFRARMDDLMRQVDVIIAPTARILPAPFEARPADYDQHASRNATVFNLTGQPSISLPCGRTAAGLSVGLMISGRHGEDARTLSIALVIEQLLRQETR